MVLMTEAKLPSKFSVKWPWLSIMFYGVAADLFSLSFYEDRNLYKTIGVYRIKYYIKSIRYKYFWEKPNFLRY